MLSEIPNAIATPPIQGIRDLLGLAPVAPIPAGLIAVVKMGTTVATNALAGAQGRAHRCWRSPAGFGDALRIGYQNRRDCSPAISSCPNSSTNGWSRSPNAWPPTGRRSLALDRAAMRAGSQAAFATGIRAVAIVFMHGYRYPDHEEPVADIARAMGFTQISTSHETAR